ncbi:MAG: molybdopterin-dependent oxidoreductase [Acidobacteriota bacterium]|nr:molybdopterin-dependent oxidoreductase [Acidobacteriota bacterium]
MTSRTVSEDGRAERTAYRICPLCEATCNLELTVKGDRITRVRGDRSDSFSRGFLCPKGASLNRLIEDPARLRQPMAHTSSGHVPVSWAEAWERVRSGLAEVERRHGRQSFGIYMGNPNCHNLAGLMLLPEVGRALGTRHHYSASTLDQAPKQVACGLLYGDPFAVAVPDIDRTDHLLLLGANPVVSNGSLASAPDWPGRLSDLRRRGGRLVVVDPVRSATADLADEHLRIRPGSDGLLLLAVLHVLFSEGLVRLGHLEGLVDGVEDVRALTGPFSPHAVAGAVGLEPEVIRRVATELAAARRAAVYGRIGTTTTPFGTATSWLVDVVNIVTGNLDREGGAMFARPAHGRVGGRNVRREFSVGRWRTRVRGLPEVLGEFPVAALAEEIEEPGDGQLRALICVAGNPALSSPDSNRMERALASLEFMVAVDPYLNDTTRHADVILPPADHARVAHYDVWFSTWAVRNVARASPPVLPLDGQVPDEDILLGLLAVLAGGDAGTAGEESVTRALHRAAAALAAADPTRSGDALPVGDVEALRRSLTGSTVCEKLVDIAVRSGPYGDLFGRRPGGLTWAAMISAPHGLDLGPLQPRLPELLLTPNGRIDLCPPILAGEVDKLRGHLGDAAATLVLVGRRTLRSHNSWLHNLPTLLRGAGRCTLQIHPDDAARLGVADGAVVRVTSAAGRIESVTAEVTDRMRPGVVSLPHGWGSAGPGTPVAVAAGGVNVNVLYGDRDVDGVTGTAVFSGIAVEVAPA